jgi:cysteine desulfurase / selenocysteine lyase
VAPGVDIEPFFVGGTGTESDLDFQPMHMPTRLEAGTPNIPAMAGLLAALRWREEEGAVFEERHHAQARRLRDALRSLPGLTLYGDAPDNEWLGVMTFTLEGWEVEKLGRRLYNRYGIVCRTGLHCAPLIHPALGAPPDGTVRMSPSGFTTDAEIDITVSAITRICKQTSAEKAATKC